MRIAVNAVAVSGGGGQTYLLNILPALCAAAPEHELWVILASRHQALLPWLPSGVQPVVCRSVPRNPWLRWLWEQTVLPVLLRRWQVDVLLANGSAVLLSPAPVVLVAHNIDPYVEQPPGLSKGERARLAALRGVLWCSARVAHAVVFVSRTSARIMARRMRVPASRVRVIHHGWPGRLAGSPREASGLSVPTPYILCVADLQPHKNLEVMIAAFEHLVTADGYPGHLVIAGANLDSRSRYAQRLRSVVARVSCKARIVFAGRLAHEAVLALYAGADVFVFPSREETFGLPLLEAMGAGVPVVAADWRLAGMDGADRANVAPEICGEAAEFFHPCEPASLCAALRRVLMDAARRQELSRAGRMRAAEFSWDAAATMLLSIVEEAFQATSRPGLASPIRFRRRVSEGLPGGPVNRRSGRP